MLVVDRRAERPAARLVPPDVFGQVRLESYLTFAQRLVSTWWTLVAEQFGLAGETPEFLPFDVTQYACRQEYRLSLIHISEPTRPY